MENPGEKMYMCGACGKSFRRCDNLKKHMAIHTGARPYKCSLCHKSFRARGHLNTHLLIHTGEKPFQCSVCGKQFNQNSNLKKHIKLHTGYRPFICEICGQKFTQLCYLKEHMKTHTGERDFGCTLCPKRFKNSNQLKAHLMTHNHEKPYKCTICDKYFKYSKNYIVHKMAHDNEVLCYCSECGKEFRSENTLKRHMLVHEGVQLHECIVCGKEFKKSDNLKKHMQVHSGEKPYQCEVCGKNFRSQSNLKSHMILHSLYYPYLCEICGKKFKYKYNHIRHMKGHTGESLYSCLVCEAVFNCKSSLDTHRLVHLKTEEMPYVQESIEDVTICEAIKDEELEDIIHNIVAVDLEDKSPMEQDLIELEGKTPFECQVCGNEYTTNTNLKLHMRNHTGERPFECKLCHKDFTQKSLLKVHMRSHTNERPYECDICHKAFKHSSHLHTHMRGHVDYSVEGQPELEVSVEGHLGEPLNACDVCGKTFVRKYILKRHMLVHSDERAYSCNQCDKKFKESSHLKAHMMLHSGERPYDCNVCGKKFIQKSDQKRHMRIHSKQPSKGRPFTCTVCGLKFAYIHNLETHKIIHAMRKNKHCEEELGIDLNNSGNDCINENFPSNVVDSDKLEDGSLVVSGHETAEVVYDAVDDREDLERSTGELVLNSGNETGECLEQTVIVHNVIENAVVEPNVPVLKENIIRKIKVYSSKDCSFQNKSVENEVFSDNYENKVPLGSFRDGVSSPVAQEYLHESKSDEEMLLNQCMVMTAGKYGCKCLSCMKGDRCNRQMTSDQPADFTSNTVDYPKNMQKFQNQAFRKQYDIQNRIHGLEDLSIGKCHICSKKFSRTNNLKRHMLVHTGERAFCCGLCGKRFKEKGHLKTHKLLVHTNERPYQCEICGKRNALRSDHTRHVKSHRGERPFTCNMCGSKFATKRNMETHKIIHAMKRNKSVYRPKNDVSLETENCNSECQMVNDSGVMVCVDSEEVIPVKAETGSSRHHVIHISDKSLRCRGYENTEYEQSKSYLRIQTYTGPSIVELSDSGEMYDIVTKKNAKHIVKIFSSDPPKHIVKIHQEEEGTKVPANYPIHKSKEKCSNKSDSRDATRNSLEPVMEVQIGKITVKAIPYELAQARNKRANSSCKNFECSVCGNMFSTSHNLKVHMRIHTGERPYKCKICEKSFTQNSNLRMHMNSHMKQKNNIKTNAF